MRIMLAAMLLCVPLAAQKVHDLCMPCHSEQTSDFLTHKHAAKELSCDMCHGASEKHRAASGAAAPDRVAARDEQPAMCGACHAAARKDFTASAHGKLVLARSKTRAPSCGVCHGVHAARTAKQIDAGCGRCHNPLPAASGAHAQVTPATRCTSCHHQHTLVAKR